MRYLIVSVLVGLSAGCASQPVDNPAPAAASVAPAPAATAAPVQAAPAVAAKPETAPSGYKLVKRDGATLYCQKTKTTGSSLTKQVCVTPEDYEAMTRRTEQDRENFRRNSTLCGTGGCGGG